MSSGWNLAKEPYNYFIQRLQLHEGRGGKLVVILPHGPLTLSIVGCAPRIRIARDIGQREVWRSAKPHERPQLQGILIETDPYND